MPFLPIDFLWLAKRYEAVERGEAKEVDPEIIGILREEWTTLSVAYQKLDPFNSLVVADGFPGYLTTQVGAWQLFVPWPLVTSFPGGAVLSDLLGVGRRIAISPVSGLCLSGSSAMLGSKIEIGDLDFCQYIESPPTAIVAEAETFTTPTRGLLLIEAHYGSTVARRPWSREWRKLKAEMTKARTVDEAKRFMVDFLVSVSGFDTLPISNVILATDFKDRSRGAASQSYIYQELVAAHDSAPVPPWSLVDPSQIAKYITFLREQIDKYAVDKPLKAVKRALSLAHTIRLQDFVNEALGILLSPQSVAYVRHTRAMDVAEKYKDCTDTEREYFGDFVDVSIRKEIDDGGGMGSPIDKVQERCENFLNRLTIELGQLERRLIIGDRRGSR